jgi:DNA-binding protein HU-beta
MNKAELINKVADDTGVTKTQANAALDSFIEAVTKTLKGGGKVTLVGFGTFSVSKRAARNGRNPQTGEVIKIKARKVARFKAGKELSAKAVVLMTTFLRSPGYFFAVGAFLIN